VRKHKGRSLFAAALAIASATKPQSLDELLVLLGLGRFQIIEELAALIDELDQPAPRRMIAFVSREMLTQSVDPLREERNLNFRGARIGCITTELRDDPAFFLSC
jgi:hypothetical protein